MSSFLPFSLYLLKPHQGTRCISLWVMPPKSVFFLPLSSHFQTEPRCKLLTHAVLFPCPKYITMHLTRPQLHYLKKIKTKTKTWMNVWAAHVSLTSHFWQGNEREYQLCEPYPLMLNALTSAPSPWRRFNFTTHIGLILISVLLYPSACVNLYLWHIWRYSWAASSYEAKSLLLLPTENMFQRCKRISLHENVSIPQAFKRSCTHLTLFNVAFVRRSVYLSHRW